MRTHNLMAYSKTWLAFSCIVMFLVGAISTTIEASEASETQGFTVNPIFNAHMVLQRNQINPIWGTAAVGSQVRLRFAGQEHSTVTDATGSWMLKVDALPANARGQTMTISSDGKADLSMPDILIGDVWICAGQSNMQWRLHMSEQGEEAVANSVNQQIRLFSVRRKASQEQQTSVVGQWSVCGPETSRTFSAVGYYFGKDLFNELEIPIGLIHSSWGGTVAEAWTSYPTLTADSELNPITTRFEKGLETYDTQAARYIKEKKYWDENQKKIIADANRRHHDPGNTGYADGWAQRDVNISLWKDASVPGFWKLPIDGAVWYRKTIQLPASMIGKELTLHLGALDDFDVSYWNNAEIGSTGLETKGFWKHKRVYTVPATLTQKAEVCIAIRIFDRYREGGWNSKPSELYISNHHERIPLAGVWKQRIELALDPIPMQAIRAPRAPMGPDHRNAPAALYNGMIEPLMPLAITGVIWYQGESNGSRGAQYRTLLPAMIADWRRGFQAPTLPFLIVQLANYGAAKEEPAADNWAELREAQSRSAHNDPHVGLAVIIDIGEAQDIHPRNKHDVGHRLHLVAQKIVYGKDLVYSGPQYVSQKIEAGAIRISLSNIGGGLVAQGGPLKRWAIAGKNQIFHWADATIDGDTVIVTSDAVAQPVAVRYAWETNPAGCNLYNAEGLPASPFRTDDWPMKSRNDR